MMASGDEFGRIESGPIRVEVTAFVPTGFFWNTPFPAEITIQQGGTFDLKTLRTNTIGQDEDYAYDNGPGFAAVGVTMDEETGILTAAANATVGSSEAHTILMHTGLTPPPATFEWITPFPTEISIAQGGNFDLKTVQDEHDRRRRGLHLSRRADVPRRRDAGRRDRSSVRNACCAARLDRSTIRS